MRRVELGKGITKNCEVYKDRVCPQGRVNCDLANTCELAGRNARAIAIGTSNPHTPITDHESSDGTSERGKQ